MTSTYVELHSASAFSFLQGASQPEKLVERAVEIGIPALALLDHNGITSGTGLFITLFGFHGRAVSRRQYASIHQR
jgi:DNA polymerase III alpha subunit